MNRIMEAVKNGTPLYLRPYKEPKVWGARGIGEYWYGAGVEGKSAVAVAGGDIAPLARVIDRMPEEVLGPGVIKIFGRTFPLVKILTPKGRLSVQFHDAKNELWVVTGIDRSMTGDCPTLIIGFEPGAVKKHGKRIRDKYRQALDVFANALNALIDELERKRDKDLLRKEGDVIVAAQKAAHKDAAISGPLSRLLDARREVNTYYNSVKVEVGDIIPVPRGTLHALGPGIEVIEPQIPGPTRSLEDGATYPVRYYFPGFPRKGAEKKLDLDRIDEMSAGIWKRGEPVIVEETGSVKVERLPGGFEDKGMEVRRITMKKGAVLGYKALRSFHILAALKGVAEVSISDERYEIPQASPGGGMLLIPACSRNYTLAAKVETQLIDTFTPCR